MVYEEQKQQIALQKEQIAGTELQLGTVRTKLGGAYSQKELRKPSGGITDLLKRQKIEQQKKQVSVYEQEIASAKENVGGYEQQIIQAEQEYNVAVETAAIENARAKEEWDRQWARMTEEQQNEYRLGQKYGWAEKIVTPKEIVTYQDFSIQRTVPRDTAYIKDTGTIFLKPGEISKIGTTRDISLIIPKGNISNISKEFTVSKALAVPLNIPSSTMVSVSNINQIGLDKIESDKKINVLKENVVKVYSFFNKPTFNPLMAEHKKVVTNVINLIPEQTKEDIRTVAQVPSSYLGGWTEIPMTSEEYKKTGGFNLLFPSTHFDILKTNKQYVKDTRIASGIDEQLKKLNEDYSAGSISYETYISNWNTLSSNKAYQSALIPRRTFGEEARTSDFKNLITGEIYKPTDLQRGALGLTVGGTEMATWFIPLAPIAKGAGMAISGFETMKYGTTQEEKIMGAEQFALGMGIGILGLASGVSRFIPSVPKTPTLFGTELGLRGQKVMQFSKLGIGFATGGLVGTTETKRMYEQTGSLPYSLGYGLGKSIVIIGATTIPVIKEVRKIKETEELRDVIKQRGMRLNVLNMQDKEGTKGEAILVAEKNVGKIKYGYRLNQPYVIVNEKNIVVEGGSGIAWKIKGGRGSVIKFGLGGRGTEAGTARTSSYGISPWSQLSRQEQAKGILDNIQRTITPVDAKSMFGSIKISNIEYSKIKISSGYNPVSTNIDYFIQTRTSPLEGSASVNVAGVSRATESGNKIYFVSGTPTTIRETAANIKLFKDLGIPYYTTDETYSLIIPRGKLTNYGVIKNIQSEDKLFLVTGPKVGQVSKISSFFPKGKGAQVSLFQPRFQPEVTNFIIPPRISTPLKVVPLSSIVRTYASTSTLAGQKALEELIFLGRTSKIFIPLSGSTSETILNAPTNLGFKERTMLLPKTDVIEISKIDNKPNVRTGVGLETGLFTSPQIQEKQLVIEIPSLLQIPTQAQKSLQSQRQITQQPTPTIQRTPSQPIPPGFDLGFGSVSKKKKTSKEVLSDMFSVYKKTKGKDVFVSTEETLFKAGSKLAKELKAGLEASGYVTRKGKKVSFGELAPSLGSEFRPAKKDMFRVVQKKEKRMGTGAETFGIQKARGKAKLGKKPMKFRW